MITAQQLTHDDESKLADDIIARRVFTDRHVKDPENIKLVFMVFSFCTPEQMEEVLTFLDPDGMVYQYCDQAGPVSIDGMPQFTSHNYLNSEQARRVLAMVKERKEANHGRTPT